MEVATKGEFARPDIARKIGDQLEVLLQDTKRARSHAHMRSNTARACVCTCVSREGKFKTPSHVVPSKLAVAVPLRRIGVYRLAYTWPLGRVQWILIQVQVSAPESYYTLYNIGLLCPF